MEGTGTSPTPPKTSILSQKLPGGQALITSIQQKLRSATSIRDLIIALESKVNAGVISLVDLVSVLEDHQVYLDKKECDVLDRRFTNSSGDLEYFRLIKTLDIGTPEEHMDPTHFEDTLPQPYRMIAKILELEIMDVAWLEILRKHPEVCEDIPAELGGSENVARRNRNLDKECHPSSQVEKTKQVVQLAAGDGEFAYSINVEGSFQVMHHASGKILRTLQLFPMEHHQEGTNEGHTETHAGGDTPAPGRKNGSLLQRVEISNTSVAESPSYMSRVAVVKIESNLPKPAPIEDSTKKGKKADNKNVPPADEVAMLPFKCHVTIVETSGRTESSFEVRVLNNFECFVCESNVRIELSQDGRMLTISHGMAIDLFKLVPMTQILDPLNAKSAVLDSFAMTTTEEDDETLGEHLPAPLVVIPPPLCQWNMQEEISRQTEKHYTNSSNPHERQKHAALLASLEGSRVWRSFLFPFLPTMQWNDAKPSASPSAPLPTPPAGGGKKGGGAGKSSTDEQLVNPLTLLPLASMPFAQQQKLAREFQNGLVVFLEDVKAFFVFGLRTMSEEEEVAYAEKYKMAMDAAILAAGGSLEEGGAVTAGGLGQSSLDTASKEKESPLLNTNPPFLELISFWSLSDAVTAVETDSQKSLLVMGQADGVVSMWDLRSLQLVDVPARHQATVTCLALTNGTKSHSLMSGDAEGTLCFYNLAVPVAGGVGGGDKEEGNSQVLTANQSASFVAMNDVQQCVKAELIDFRSDFTNEVIANMWAIPQTPIVIVQLTSMKLVAYDAEYGVLYGRLSLTSGIPGQRIEFSLLRTEDAVQYYTEPELSEEEKQRLLEEAEEEATKGKGKKGKPPAKEPAVSQEEPDLESLTPPVISPYSARKINIGMASVSSQGFCGSFLVDQHKYVLSTFSTERLVSFFCPGVASILQQLALSAGSSFDTAQPSALDVFRVLSRDERSNEFLKPSQVLSLQQMGGRVGGEMSAFSKQSLLSQSHSQSQASFKKSRKLSNSNTNSNLLTEAKLKALQQTFSPFENITALPPISTGVRQKVTIPKNLFERSCKASQLDRTRRKKTLLSRLEALSGMC